jgi:beta-lactamase superfamily II metal-dependent hydrolase
MFKRLLSISIVLFFASSLFGQPQNGNLQIHHIDVGQGDGAVLISPKGEVVLFDMGQDMKRKDCSPAIAYLDQLGITKIDYVFVSHYHFDHIGCIPAALKRFPLSKIAYDRGEEYNGQTFTNYKAAVNGHERTATVGMTLKLDDGSTNPVLLTVVTINGKSKHGTVQTSNENDLSLSVVVAFGDFREEIGGDLSGDNTNMYQDVETPVAKDVGIIDVYKVHHHCSSHSTNDAWLKATEPTIGIISTGDGNSYHHPAEDCVTRLHEAALQKVYWTERGAGDAGAATPESGIDVISGDIKIEVAPGAHSYTVSHQGAPPDTYPIKGQSSSAGTQPSPGSSSTAKKYAWSKRSSLYHDANCPDVQKILPENLVESDTPPSDKHPAACLK